MIQTEQELSLQVSDLEVQVHDIHSELKDAEADINSVQGDVSWLEDRVVDLERMEDLDDAYDLTWVVERIQDHVLENTDTHRMVGARYQRRARSNRAYFGQWFGPGIGKTWYRFRYRRTRRAWGK